MSEIAARPTEISREAWITLAVSSLAVLAVFLDTTVLFVAFPDIVSSFETVAPTQLSWVLNGYTIVFAALLIPAGKFADRTGHKRTFIGGSVVFTIGSLLCALAPSANLLIAFRIVQAVGAAALLPASLALVLRAFPASKVPLAVAIWGSTGALAGALGPTLGAILVDVGSWHWVFLINIPIGLFTIVVGRRVLDESNDPDAVVPAPLGVVLIGAAAALISLGVVQSDTWGWSDPRTIAALTAGSVILALFVVQQRRTPAPVLDLELFKIRNFAWGNSATLAFSMAFTAMFFSSILFLTQVWNYSTITAGLAVAPGPLIVAVLAPVMGTLAGRIGQRPMLITGGLLFAAGGAWRLVMLGDQADYLVDYLPSMIFTGLGVALCLPQLSSVVAQSLPPNRFGVGGGVNQAIRQFAGTLGVALTIAFVASSTTLDSALSNFDKVWWLLILGGTATSGLSLALRTRRPAPARVAAALSSEAA